MLGEMEDRTVHGPVCYAVLSLFGGGAKFSARGFSHLHAAGSHNKQNSRLRRTAAFGLDEDSGSLTEG